MSAQPTPTPPPPPHPADAAQPQTPPPAYRVALLAFDGMEAMDFAGPFEVFTTAARMHARTVAAGAHCRLPQAPQPPLFTVTTVAPTQAPVVARAGLRVLPDLDCAQHARNGTPADLLLVPGGVVDAAMACPVIRQWVQATAATATWTGSVCTGAFILAAAGVLHGRATTHWEDLDDLRQRFPALEVVGGVQWVDQGRVLTSAGISAGVGMSLHLVSKMAQHAGLDGPALAQRTARQLETPWNPLP